jgi:succinate dehydrogenase / fumarate reductase membrane anchor subunit
MNYQSPLARARGLGAAGEGSHEWWRQRVTAIALIPLTFWFAASVARLPGMPYGEVLNWIKAPWNSILLLSFIIIVAYHTMLGLQVIIEDYVHIDWLKILSLLGMKLVFSFLGLAALYATLRILFVD